MQKGDSAWSEEGFRMQKHCMVFDQRFEFRRDLSSLPELYCEDCALDGKFVFGCLEPSVYQPRKLNSGATTLKKGGRDTGVLLAGSL